MSDVGLPGAALALALLLCAAALPPGGAAAAPGVPDVPDAPEMTFDCQRDGFHWSRGRPAINLRHLFCGERRDGRPKGLHTTALAATWDHGQRLERRSDEGGGIFSAIVVFADGQRKFSTFFPERCTAAQVIRSIEYAAAHVRRRHKQWGRIGPSAPKTASKTRRPADGHEMFCLDNEGFAFEIRLGALADGRINTAFPN